MSLFNISKIQVYFESELEWPEDYIYLLLRLPRVTDLIFFWQKKHRFLTREGDDLYLELELNLLESLCGWSARLTAIKSKSRKPVRLNPVLRTVIQV